MLQCTLLLQQQLTGSLRPATLKQTVRQCATQNRFLYSLIIISIFLACYRVAKKWNNFFVLLWGPLFGRTCLNRPLVAAAAAVVVIVVVLVTYSRSDDNWLEPIKDRFDSDRCIQAAEVHYWVWYCRRSLIKWLNYQHKPYKYLKQHRITTL